MKETNRTQLKKSVFVALIMVLAAFLAVGTVTVAWFTSNTKVETSRVTVKTSEEEVSLLVSASSDGFKGSDECDIVQVNVQDQEKLLPVSTADLVTFVYGKGSDGQGTRVFAKVPEEKYYYHGRIYIKAEGPESMTGESMAVYLDNTEGRLTPDLDSKIASASRIGLSVNGKDPVICRLSDEKLTTRKNNTVLNGAVLDDGYVLDGSGSTTEARPDPSILFPESGSLSEKPVFRLSINQIYPLDIYFYLEGCDADCTEDISLDGITFSLGFFGALGE